MKKREETNKNEKGLMNKNFGIEYFDVALFMKQKQRRNKKKERDKNKEPKESKKERQEGRKKEERKREAEKKKVEKGEAKKGQGERKGNTQKYRKNGLLGGKQVFVKDKERKGEKKQKSKQKNNQKTNKEGSGPPHLTLKPSKETTKKKNKKTKQNNRNNKTFSKMSFSVIRQNFLFLGGCPKFPFFDNLAQKTRTQKHCKNRGSSLLFFEKKICVTKRPFLDQKTQIQKFQLSFFLPTFFSFNNKKLKIVLKPLFL